MVDDGEGREVFRFDCGKRKGRCMSRSCISSL